jgi:hypothetical protein
MSKELKIKLLLDNAQARASNRQSMADIASSVKAYGKQGAAADAAQKRAAAAATTAAKTQFVALDKVRLAHTNFIDQVAKKKAAADAKAAASTAATAKAQFVSLEKVALAHTNFIDRVTKKQQAAAAAAVASEKRKQASLDQLESKYVADDQKRRTKQVEQAEKTAQRKANADIREAQRKQATLDRIENKFLADEYRRRVRYDQAKAASAAKDIALAKRVALSKTQAALRAAAAERSALDVTAKSQDSLIGKVGNLAAAYLSIAAVVGTFKKIVDITNEAAEAASNHAKETLKVRDALRELAAMKGKSGPTDEDVKRYAGMRNVSGLSHEESVTFGNELFNALGTVPTEKLSETEREQLSIGGAKSAARLGGGTEGAKARAGVIGVLPNYLQGDNGQPLTARKVLGYADRAEMITGMGNFDQVQGAQQLQELMTSITSEKLVGTEKNPLKAAALNAVASKFGKGEAASNSMRAIRAVSSLTAPDGMHGQKERVAEALKDWGVTEDMTPTQRMEQVFKALDTNAKGRNVQAYLAETGFGNETENEQLGKFYEQWQNGTWQQFMAEADKQVDEAAPEKKFNAFAASKVGRARLAEAHRDTAIVEAGIPQENLNIARTEGEAEAIKQGLDQSWTAQAGLFIKGLTMFSQSAAKDSFHEDLGMQKARKELGMAPPKMDAATAAMSAIPVIGPLLPSNINHWTGFNQKEADRIDGERQAQGLGLMGGQAQGGNQNQVVPLLNKMVGLMQQQVRNQPPKAGPVPRPQGKPPGQGRRP